MVGTTSGFMQLFIKEVKHQVIQFHCIMHQKALCPKGSSKKLDKILKNVTKYGKFHHGSRPELPIVSSTS